jgi:hypothetical protein
MIFCLLGESCFERFNLIKVDQSNSDLVGNFNSLIPPNQFNERYLRLNMGQLLTNAGTQSRAKTNKRKGMNLIALTLPSFRSKLIRIFEVLLAKMIGNWLNGYYCALTDRNILDVIILTSNSGKYPVRWSIVSSRFVLDPIDVGKLLHILVSDVWICLDYGVDLFPQSFLNLGKFSYIVDHHCEETGCCASASNQKCLKLIH